MRDNHVHIVDGPLAAQLDKSTAALEVIEHPHHEVHGGSAYQAHYNVDVSDINFRTGLSFKTPNTAKWCHLLVSVHATDLAVAYLYEDVQIAGGAAGQPNAVTVYNRHRNTSNTSGVISQHSTPVTGGASGWTEALLQDAAPDGNDDWDPATDGTEIDRIPLGGGSNPVRTIGGEGRGAQEWLLKQNSVYMVVIQSSNANDNTHSIRMDWYEHTNKL